jgi:hypothetical protein
MYGESTVIRLPICPPKHCYLPASPHGFTTHNTHNDDSFSQQINIPSSLTLLSSSSHGETGCASLTAFSSSWLGALEYGVTIRRFMAGMDSQ